MAKSRIVNTRFWDDSYIARLSPNEKLVFLYLLTSPLTTIAGVYELPVKRAAFDIGLPAKEIDDLFLRFETDGKLIREGDWIAIVNFIKHQSLNPKVRQGILAALRQAPKSLVAKLVAKLPENIRQWIGFDSLSIASDSLSHLNLNSNLNFNSNSNANRDPQGYPHPVDKAIGDLAERMRIKTPG